MSTVDRGPSGRKPSAFFSPVHVHRAFGMHLPWARALEGMRRPDGRRMPGSARRVLEVLLGSKALNKGPVSQMGIVRLSGRAMPRSTVQVGLKALIEVGIVEQVGDRWSLVLAQSEGPKPCQDLAPDNGEVPSPITPLMAPAGAGQSEEPQGKRKEGKASKWARALEAAGWSRGGSWSLGRKLGRLEFIPGAAGAALALAQSRPHRDAHALAGHILLTDMPAVKRKLKRSAAGGMAPPPRSLGDAVATWKRLEAAMPPSENPGFLDALDATRAARRVVQEVAEMLLDPLARQRLDDTLTRELEASGATPGLVWQRAWNHHWLTRALRLLDA